ncbi:hypothetical protein NC653_015463 [Populus alba x Populus x berolinensis]|uniref:Uncharacterized protein n=1 Tax=Populus alba x Populus x berolinensis TaxID=444605 RepID=A0AAD6QKP5_9ROSI|nr:hypothetical protein NC653_015463 [Populus alba x Populus x berolinensis]
MYQIRGYNSRVALRLRNLKFDFKLGNLSSLLILRSFLFCCCIHLLTHNWYATNAFNFCSQTRAF